jgi:hypothetical protein
MNILAPEARALQMGLKEQIGDLLETDYCALIQYQCSSVKSVRLKGHSVFLMLTDLRNVEQWNRAECK